MGYRGENEVHDYTFGALKLSVRGLGVYFGGETLDAWLKSATLDELRAANRDAWRQRRPLERAAARENNVTRYGWNDRRDSAIGVCEVVCQATWRAMRGRGG